MQIASTARVTRNRDFRVLADFGTSANFCYSDSSMIIEMAQGKKVPFLKRT